MLHGPALQLWSSGLTAGKSGPMHPQNTAQAASMTVLPAYFWNRSPWLWGMASGGIPEACDREELRSQCLPTVYEGNEAVSTFERLVSGLFKTSMINLQVGNRKAAVLSLRVLSSKSLRPI